MTKYKSYIVVFFYFLVGCPLLSLALEDSRPLSEVALKNVLKEAYTHGQYITEGQNADYIPYLSGVDSTLFSVVIATVDGQLYQIGDYSYEFGIESISKVFVLAQAMQEVGPKVIQDKIGVTATGFPFNSATAIELQRGKAGNPLVNAGAIATNSLIKAKTPEAQFLKINRFFNELANREISVIMPLYESEASTNARNRALAWLVSASGSVDGNPEDALDSYTRQCSFGVNTRDLAVMASTLANKGVNPFTKVKLINSEYIPKILACMLVEGLYENSGEWLYKVGVPAKSGVGGGLIAVVPGKMAIAAFAPPLDKNGNSVRAQFVIDYIVNKLNLNLFN